MDFALLGTSLLQSQTCTTDYIRIPSPSQNDIALASDRFCGMGFTETSSRAATFTISVTTDANETPDIANRGFYLNYQQRLCPF